MSEASCIDEMEHELAVLHDSSNSLAEQLGHRKLWWKNAWSWIKKNAPVALLETVKKLDKWRDLKDIC